MLITICRKDDKTIDVLIDNNINDEIPVDIDVIEDLQVETMLLFNDAGRLVEVFYDIG